MPRYEFRTAEQEAAENAARVKVARPVLKAQGSPLRDLQRLQEMADDKPLIAASLVNYASAPVGGAVYDSNWLASNTTAR